MQTAKQRLASRRKAQTFIKRVNEHRDAQIRAGIDEPGWPLDDLELACEAFELAFSFGGVETVES